MEFSKNRFSSYSGGFSNGVLIQEVPVSNVHSGKVFWVDSNGPGNSGGGSSRATIDSPALTLDESIRLCRANRGDIIMIKAGHTENISSDTALNLDVAGISIIGLGVGLAKPKITLDTATATTIPVRADNVSISNIRFSANHNPIETCFNLTSVNGFSLSDCQFVSSGISDQVFSVVIEAFSSNEVSVSNCSWVQLNGASISFIIVSSNDTSNGVVVDSCYLNTLPALSFPSVVQVFGILTNIQISNCDIIRLNSSGARIVSLESSAVVSSSTGIIRDCNVRHLDTAGESFLTAGSGINLFQNFGTAVIDASGYLVPAFDS